MSPTGHLAIGFAAKKYAPKIPIGVILIAAYVIDLIYFIFLALGIEKINYNPWSHSLLMAIIWSLFAGVVTLSASKELRSALVIGLVVFSHWILDFIVWGNLSLFFDKTNRVGLGLYDMIGFSLTSLKFDSGTILAAAIELSMLFVGLAVYLSFLRKLRKEKKNYHCVTNTHNT
jgi:hypothetical protein